MNRILYHSRNGSRQSKRNKKQAGLTPACAFAKLFTTSSYLATHRQIQKICQVLD